MPQLNPNPWFMILIFTWTVTLTLLKLTTHRRPLQLPKKTTLVTQTTTQPWTWQ